MKHHYFAAALVCAFSTGSAAAGTAWEQGGTGTGTASNSPMEIADGHMVMQTSSTYENVEMEDADHPMNGATGPCFGAVEAAPGGVSGGGICAFTDKAGDKVVLHWHAEGMDASGALTGSWKLSGGTGPWAAAEGGGTFSSLTDPASGNFVNTITSSVTMP